MIQSFQSFVERCGIRRMPLDSKVRAYNLRGRKPGEPQIYPVNVIRAQSIQTTAATAWRNRQMAQAH